MGEIQIFFFPLMGQGHMIPLFDVARLFASRGAKSTLITTPGNAPIFPESDDIEIQILQFPSQEVSLPAGIENISHLTGPDQMSKFNKALKLIAEGPLKELLQDRRPSCLVSDIFMPWAAGVASDAGIPWVAFHGGGYFAMAVSRVLRLVKPQWRVESEDDEFIVPGLPGDHEFRLTRRKISPVWTETEVEEEKTPFTKLVEWASELVEETSFGVIMNSFYELESDYVDHFREVSGTRCWSLGPVSLSSRNIDDKEMRGKQGSIDVQECMRWLDSKPENSVIYVSFGSIAHLPPTQLTEIAMALEASEQHFIWVIRRPIEDNKEWLPNGFEERIQCRGLIITGWAPQVSILDHKATCGFLTHCGWNSTLEGVSAGVPMVTWPMFAEQSLNEMLITEVLKVGVPVGAKENNDWMVAEAMIIGREEIEAAVMRVMVGEEAEEMRRRVGGLKEMAWNAVQPGGSSYNALTDMLKILEAVQITCCPK